MRNFFTSQILDASEKREANRSRLVRLGVVVVGPKPRSREASPRLNVEIVDESRIVQSESGVVNDPTSRSKDVAGIRAWICGHVRTD